MPREFGLIGRPLGHSFSKAYFTSKFHEQGIDAIYENFELEHIKDLGPLLAAHPRLQGLNVTIPYKEAVIASLDHLSSVAREVGAVNCIDLRGGLAIGHNTDVVGFRDSLAEVYGQGPGGDAWILGTGGAAKAVDYVLRHYFEFERVRSVSRSHPGTDRLRYSDLEPADYATCRLVVNTTPLGMFPNTDAIPPITVAHLPQDCLVFDLIYNPERTLLLQQATAHGCPTRNGLDMLIRQAEAAWAIWNT